MNESVCSNVGFGESCSSVGEVADTVLPFKQLICSQNQAEVYAIKEELSRAGIDTETRSNAMAEALGVTGIELWVRHERDFSDAANLLMKLQAQSHHGLQDQTRETATPTSASKCAAPVQAPELQKLEEDTSFLEKKVEEMLDFQREVTSQCVSVSEKTRALRHSIKVRQAALSVETEKRAAAQKKQFDDVSKLQADLERKRMDCEHLQKELESERQRRGNAEDQIRSQHNQLQQQSDAQGNRLKKAQEKLELQSRLLQTHTAAVLKLTKEVATLEKQKEEERNAISILREELALEKKARLAAEQRADIAEQESVSDFPSRLLRRLGTKKASIH